MVAIILSCLKGLVDLLIALYSCWFAVVTFSLLLFLNSSLIVTVEKKLPRFRLKHERNRSHNASATIERIPPLQLGAGLGCGWSDNCLELSLELLLSALQSASASIVGNSVHELPNPEALGSEGPSSVLARDSEGHLSSGSPRQCNGDMKALD